MPDALRLDTSALWLRVSEALISLAMRAKTPLAARSALASALRTGYAGETLAAPYLDGKLSVMMILLGRCTHMTCGALWQ